MASPSLSPFVSHLDAKIAELDAIVENVLAASDRQQQIEALTAAYHILDRATGKAAGEPCFRAYRLVRNARDRVAKQIEALLAPIFEEN